MKKTISRRLLLISFLLSSLFVPHAARAETWGEWTKQKAAVLITAGAATAAVLGYWGYQFLYGGRKKPNNAKRNQGSSNTPNQAPPAKPYVPVIKTNTQEATNEDMIQLDTPTLETIEEIRTSEGDSKPTSKNDFIEWAVSSEQGDEEEQQDRFAVDNLGDSLEFFAVFDGNNGSAVAEQLKKELSKIFFKKMKPGISVQEALYKACRTVDSTFKKFENQGATATIFIAQGNKGYFAQLGNTRGSLIREDNVLIQTKENNIDITSTGKTDTRVLKSFGNFRNKTKEDVWGKLSQPQITEFALKKGDIIILGTQGLNILSNNQLTLIIQHSQPPYNDPQEWVQRIVNLAIKNQKKAAPPQSLNSTALIIKINQDPPLPSKAPLVYSIARPKRKDPKTGKMTPQEYRYTLHKQQGNLIFFGLYEGIGGTEVASLVRSFLYKRFFEHVKTMKIEVALTKAFQEVDDQIKQKGRTFHINLAEGIVNTFDCIGSTAAVCVIDTGNNKAYFSSQGLPIYFLEKNNKKLNILQDQKSTTFFPINEDNCSNKSLTLSSAFGYYAYKPKLSSIPKTVLITLSFIKQIILLTTTTNTSLGTNKATSIQEALKSENPAQDLVKKALAAKALDATDLTTDLIEKTTALVITIN